MKKTFNIANLGGCFKGKDGFKKIKDISKKYKTLTFSMSDDNYSQIGMWLIRNGKCYKYSTHGNPEYDLDKTPMSPKLNDSVLLKFSVIKTWVTEEF